MLGNHGGTKVTEPDFEKESRGSHKWEKNTILGAFLMFFVHNYASSIAINTKNTIQSIFLNGLNLYMDCSVLCWKTRYFLCVDPCLILNMDQQGENMELFSIKYGSPYIYRLKPFRKNSEQYFWHFTQCNH